jgi:hypothetical protein
MSRPVRERLIELEKDVEQVLLAPAAAVRARGLRRARRRFAGTAVAVIALVGAAGFGLTGVIGSGGTPAPVPAATPPAGSAGCAYPVDLSVPDSPGRVELRVLPGAGPAGQAAMAVQELGERGFTARETPGSDPAAEAAETAAVLRYGPGAIGASTLVRALIGGKAVMRFDPGRDGSAVDLVLGAGFRGLATPTEVNQALVEAGEPTPPPGC